MVDEIREELGYEVTVDDLQFVNRSSCDWIHKCEVWEMWACRVLEDICITWK